MVLSRRTQQNCDHLPDATVQNTEGRLNEAIHLTGIFLALNVFSTLFALLYEVRDRFKLYLI